MLSNYLFFLNIQVCSEKNDFENDFTDDRHWATDLNDVREAFYDYAGQVHKHKLFYHY